MPDTAFKVMVGAVIVPDDAAPAVPSEIAPPVISDRLPVTAVRPVAVRLPTTTMPPVCVAVPICSLLAVTLLASASVMPSTVTESVALAPTLMIWAASVVVRTTVCPLAVIVPARLMLSDVMVTPPAVVVILAPAAMVTSWSLALVVKVTAPVASMSAPTLAFDTMMPPAVETKATVLPVMPDRPAAVPTVKLLASVYATALPAFDTARLVTSLALFMVTAPPAVTARSATVIVPAVSVTVLPVLMDSTVAPAGVMAADTVTAPDLVASLRPITKEPVVATKSISASVKLNEPAVVEPISMVLFIDEFCNVTTDAPPVIAAPITMSSAVKVIAAALVRPPLETALVTVKVPVPAFMLIVPLAVVTPSVALTVLTSRLPTCT